MGECSQREKTVYDRNAQEILKNMIGKKKSQQRTKVRKEIRQKRIVYSRNSLDLGSCLPNPPGNGGYREEVIKDGTKGMAALNGFFRTISHAAHTAFTGKAPIGAGG